jgi:hypothetical protein
MKMVHGTRSENLKNAGRFRVECGIEDEEEEEDEHEYDDVHAYRLGSSTPHSAKPLRRNKHESHRPQAAPLGSGS